MKMVFSESVGKLNLALSGNPGDWEMTEDDCEDDGVDECEDDRDKYNHLYGSGLAEVAGAIGNGPLAALGEEVEKTEIVSKRKRTLVESLNAQEEGSGVKEPKICTAGQKENLEMSLEELPEMIPEQKMEPSLEQKIELSLEQKVELSLEQKMKLSLEQKMESSLEQKMESSLEQKMEPSLERKMKPSLEQKMKPSLEQKIEPVTPGKNKVLTQLLPTSSRQVSTESSLVATDGLWLLQGSPCRCVTSPPRSPALPTTSPWPTSPTLLPWWWALWPRI